MTNVELRSIEDLKPHENNMGFPACNRPIVILSFKERG